MKEQFARGDSVSVGLLKGRVTHYGVEYAEATSPTDEWVGQDCKEGIAGGWRLRLQGHLSASPGIIILPSLRDETRHRSSAVNAITAIRTGFSISLNQPDTSSIAVPKLD